MFKVLILAEESGQIRKLGAELVESGFSCGFCSNRDDLVENFNELDTDLIMVVIDDKPLSCKELSRIKDIKQKNNLPAIALVSQDMLSLDFDHCIDDFVVEPWALTEVVARAKRVTEQNKKRDEDEIIRCGDLVIDLKRWEVSVSGRVVSLTFKEYELLKFLASNRGRVFTRESLLNSVWGYDYYGGDRTVDVHIRRLRSKIEDATHGFIRTVRNIGYCFREDV